MISASSGDTIIVEPGTYTENININKDLILRAQSDDPEETTITALNAGTNVISSIARAGVVIKGFTITGAGTNFAGVYIERGRACTVEDNIFSNNGIGVNIENSQDCVVQNNIVDRTSGIGTGRGINVYDGSSNTTLLSNTVSNQGSGIYITGSDDNSISENVVSFCNASGIRMENSDNSDLENNEANSNGDRGIYLFDSKGNTLTDNVFSFNFGNGIELELSDENTVIDNTVTGNTSNSSTNNHGIMLKDCEGNLLQSNTVSACEYGFAVSMASADNTVVNNTATENDRGFYIAYGSNGNTLSRNKANSNNLNGITLISPDSRITTNNIVDNNEANLNGNYGIYLESTTNNKISNNIASDNYRGINLLGSITTGNLISGNTLSSNNGNGIRLEGADDNDIVSNFVDSNGGYGIYIVSSSDLNSLDSNRVEDNDDIGIYVDRSLNNTLSKNEASGHNSKPGIMLSLSNDTTLSRNRAFSNDFGISLNSSERNTISGNYLTSNGKGIFACPRSIDNDVNNNYFNNTFNTDIENNRCSWNIEKTLGKNIMGGSHRGGNYWGSPARNGFSDLRTDADGDGIIAEVFSANPDGEGHYRVVDSLPLARIINPDPVASFITSTTYGIAPRAVQFTDRSENAASWNWNFGDGSANSTQQNPTHTFSTAGTRTVRLTVTGNGKSDTTTTAITILEQIVTGPPVASFTSNVSSGFAPLAVQFTDNSEGATEWSWDFDNDGDTDSTARNPVHVYSTVGNYTVELTAENEKGTDSTTAIITARNFTIQPVADFTTNVASGSAPLTVQFTDRSQNATGWTWTFGDGATSYEQNPSHTYSSAGTYTASLTAGNANGTSSKAATITVSSGGGGGGSGGGGGGGGSPEPATNVQVKELAQTQVTNGKTVKFDFARNATCIMSITFDAKKTAGKTTGTVEMLKEKSTLVSTLPSGEVYKFFNIWIGNAGFSTASNIANPVINFKVEKAWIQNKNIDPASITLNRYSDKKWEQIPTSLTGEDSNYLYFTAKTPGFSPFGITGKAKEASTQITPVPTSTQNNPGSDVPQKTATEQKTETPANKPAPGFEVIYGIIGLFAVLGYKRK